MFTYASILTGSQNIVKVTIHEKKKITKIILEFKIKEYLKAIKIIFDKHL